MNTMNEMNAPKVPHYQTMKAPMHSPINEKHNVLKDQ